MMKYKLKNLLAFTLTEVLIALGIIGVVAALTLPVVIKEYQKIATVNKLKTTYSILNHALQKSVADNGEFEYWGMNENMTAEEYFNKYWKPYLSVMSTCKTGFSCGYNTDAPWYCIDSQCVEYFNISGYDMIGVKLNNGTFLVIYAKSFNGKFSREIAIDINGAHKPNLFGKDYFTYITTNKGVLCSGYNKTMNEINQTCSVNGLYCLCKIINDSWKIKDDYPW